MLQPDISEPGVTMRIPHQIEQTPTKTLRDIPAIVLDTNAVLDWLVFHNPCSAAWTQVFENGTIRWLVTKAMREELAYVLNSEALKIWSPDGPKLWATWSQFAQTVPEPVMSGPALRLRCTDPDDQKFIDLAATNAKWLISRDRAVLKLTRRAALLGLQILTPEQWKPQP